MMMMMMMKFHPNLFILFAGETQHPPLTHNLLIIIIIIISIFSIDIVNYMI